MKPNPKRPWLLIAFLGFFVASAVKHLYNGLSLSLYDAYNGPQSRSVASARRQGILVAEFEVVQLKLACEGRTYEFKEAWLEAAYEPRTFLVWFPYNKRADWSYLCVRPATEWFQQDYFYSLKPEYQDAFRILGRGRNGEAFTL